MSESALVVRRVKVSTEPVRESRSDRKDEEAKGKK